MARKYKRQYVQHEGRWMQKRAKGKAGSYNLCEACALYRPDDDATNCKRAIGLRNFCIATDMIVVVWECPDFGTMVTDEEWK